MMPAAPDPHAIAIMLLTLVALVLFSQERVPLETSSLLVFIALVAGFEIFPYESEGEFVSAADLFAGFGHEALVAVCALMVLGKGLETTGALQPIARALTQVWRTFPSVSLLLTMLVAGAVSAVVNNTPIVVMLLPILVGVTMSTGASPSGVLMPFGLATIIGGSMTTIGTSTNLLVVSVARDLGVQPFGMFDFFLPLALVGTGGILFLWIAGPRLVPRRTAPISDQSARLFSAVLYVEETSKIAGKTLRDARTMVGGDLRLLDIRRKGVQLMRLPTLVFVPGDRLHVRNTPGRLKEFESTFGTPLHDQEAEEAESADGRAERSGDKQSAPKAAKVAAKQTSVKQTVRHEDDAAPSAKQSVDAASAEKSAADRATAEKPASDDAKQRLVEVVVTEDSPLNESTIRRERFADDYGLFVLALHRGQLRQEVRRDALADIELTTGDVLLVQGSAGDIKRLKSNPSFLVLDSTIELPDTRKAPLALGIMVGVVVMAAVGLLPISVAALIGVALMLASGCMDWREAGTGLSTQVVMIIVTSLALGTSLTVTGATDYVADLFVVLSEGMSPNAMLGGLMLLMALLTNIISNNAAGIIGTPVAIGIASKLGLAPEPFVVAIIAGVNLSFATPMAYQTNLLVMNAGGYRFTDFVRVGVPLALLMWAAYVFVIPLFFPF